MRFHWSALLVTLVLSSLPSGFSHAQTPAQAPNVSGQGRPRDVAPEAAEHEVRMLPPLFRLRAMQPAV